MRCDTDTDFGVDFEMRERMRMRLHGRCYAWWTNSID